MAWRTLVRASVVCAALLAALNLACAQNLVKNGNFTEPGDPAANWDKAKADKGSLVAYRDTQTYVSSPASLCLQGESAGSMGNCGQMVPITRAGSYRVRGAIKVSNVGSGGIALIPFGKGTQIGWNEIAFQIGTSDWADFDAITRIPDGADSVLVLAFGVFEKDSRLWVDDLVLEPIDDPRMRIMLADLAGNVLRTPTDAWIGHVTGTNEGMKISASGTGGAGLGRWIDLSNKTNFVPVMYIKPLPGNTATQIAMGLVDDKGTERLYRFKMPTNQAITMPVIPENAASVGKPNEGPAGPLPLIKEIRLHNSGNPGDHTEILVRGIELVAPGQTVTLLPPHAPVAGTSGGPMSPPPTAAASAVSPAAASPAKPAPLPPEGAAMVNMKTEHPGAYGEWQSKMQSLPEGFEVRQGSPQGGIVFSGARDLSALAAGVPTLTVKTLPGNQAKSIVLLLRPVSGETIKMLFTLPPVGQEARVPVDGNTVLNTTGLDLAHMSEIHLQGDYGTNAPMAFQATRLDAALPGQASGAAAAPSLDLGSRSRPQGVTADPPVITSVSVQSASYVVVTIASQQVVTTPPQKYAAQADDVLEEVENFPNLQKLSRGERFIGYVDTSSHVLYSADVLKGAGLMPEESQRTDLYQLTSKEDRNYLKPVNPVSVQVRACPDDFALPAMSPAIRYVAYLQMAKPLNPERSYELSMGSDIKPAKFRFSALKMRGEALHVAQGGFRIDDPLKMGRLSLWIGTGGKLPYVPKGFNVIEDSTSKSVVQGKLELAKADSVSGTDVYLMDFSSLKIPGKYRLYVPEMGVSDTFTIDPTAWEDAFQVSMRGFYVQRSGIEIGPPYVDFARKRTYHPLDGVKVHLGSFSLLETNLAPGDQGSDYRALAAKDLSGKTLSEIVGGYHESGTSTLRRVQHLDATRMMLELYLMFPNYYSRLTINLPKAGRSGPDLLNEALWNLSLYQSLQQPDGGVCGAVIDPTANMGYPVPPMTGQDLVATAPDVYSTYCYAATAARAAVALKNADAALSAKLEQSATRAMEWAEKQLGAYAVPNDVIRAAIRDHRNLAAADLLRLTGNKAFHDIFVASTCLNQAPARSYRIGEGACDQREAAFVYARLPETMVDPSLRKAALEALKNDADGALALAQSNSWGYVAHPDSQLGMFASFPAMSLLHGHYVYKNEAYLKAALSHASFLLGGNPSNVSFVTGIGNHFVSEAVYPITRIMRQPIPRGLTVFGPFAQSSNFADLEVVKKHLEEVCLPKPADWPSAQSYMDCYIIDPENSYSIQQTLGPTSYLLGYLAAR